MADDVLSKAGVPANRRADLLARWPGGLTAAERMAVEVLRGGSAEVVGPFIDAALEEFGHGGYRVPVRVVVDPSRAFLVLKMGEVSFPGSDHDFTVDPMEMWNQVNEAVRGWLADPSGTPERSILLPPGWTLDVYEAGRGGEL